MSGSWSWQLLRAGAFRLDGGSMFGVVPKVVWSKHIRADAQNRIDLQTNCLMLDNGEHKVLIETGYGDKWTPKDRRIFHMEQRSIREALHEDGVSRGEIDLVIVTHLHFDHAGGLTHLDASGEPSSTFPNAKIVCQGTEWNDALANKSTMTRTYLRSHLDPVAEQMRLADGEVEVLPGLFVFPTPGHTWGHQAARFADDRGVVCFPGDVMPTAAHAGLACNMGYDMLPYTNTQTKRLLLRRAAEEGWRLVLDHEPHTPIMCARQEEADRFVLEPAES